MDKEPGMWYLEMGRLVALAERFASEGQMNLNKLVEAAVYAELRSAGWRYRPRVTSASMQAELEAGIRFLRKGIANSEQVAALETGRQALTEHRHADLLFSGAPDPFVCRACGQVSLGSAPSRCPTCGAWPGRFRKFVAFFNGDNIEPTNPAEVLAVLAKNDEDLGQLVGDLPEDATLLTPSGTGWSIRDHIAHFSDTQDMLDTRVALMLEYDNPELKALQVFELATESGRQAPSTRALLVAFREKRRKCVERLQNLPLKDLWRTGRHPEFGELTILRQAAYLAFHEQTHLPEIETLRTQVA